MYVSQRSCHGANDIWQESSGNEANAAGNDFRKIQDIGEDAGSCLYLQMQILKHWWNMVNKQCTLGFNIYKKRDVIREEIKKKNKSSGRAKSSFTRGWETAERKNKLNLRVCVCCRFVFLSRSTSLRITSTTSQTWGATLWESPPLGWRESFSTGSLTGYTKVCAAECIDSERWVLCIFYEPFNHYKCNFYV